MLKILRRQKGAQVAEVKKRLSVLYGSERNRAFKIIENCDVVDENYVFVSDEGAIWRPDKLTQIMKEFGAILKLPHPQQVVPYSLRIGATSLANQQQIEILKILRYVVWSVNHLPHVVGRYIQFTIYDLMIVPFEMIHGCNRPGFKTKDLSQTVKLPVFNPWEGDQVRQLFGIERR